MKLKRRAIPYIVAGSTTAIWAAVIVFSVISERNADRYTVLNLAIGYGAKVIGFSYMRRRMVDDDRRLTVFGLAIVDFFTALIIFATSLCGISLWLFWSNAAPGLYLRLFNRLALNFGIWLIVGTIAAVIYEMNRAPSPLEVHKSDADASASAAV